MRPYSIVEDVGLKKLVQKLSNNRYSLPDRKTLTGLTPELFLLVEREVWILGMYK